MSKKYALFNKKNGIIIGFCNDSFCMTYRYHCVHVWNAPPNHYFDPAKGDFIICLNKEYDDVRVLHSKENHTFKGNFIFEQRKDGDWVRYQNTGPVNLKE